MIDELGAVEVVDALDFLDPYPIQLHIGGCHVEAETLGFYDWIRYEQREERAIQSLLRFEFYAALCKLIDSAEFASALQFDGFELGEALVALVEVSEANRCRYIDPFFLELVRQDAQGEPPVTLDDGLNRRFIVQMVLELLRRFSLRDISMMRPELAFFAYQSILDSQADDRAVAFYQNELGYNKRRTGKGKSARERWSAKSNPYLTPWMKGRRKALRDKRRAMRNAYPDMPSPLITHPEKVVDLEKPSR